MNKKHFTTLANLARDLQVNKSKLLYYLEMGLIKPVETLGATGIYDKKKTTSVIRKIKTLQDKGYSLKKIKAKLDNAN